MSRITPTQVMIERNDQLARDPKHLKRLMDFWPVENIVHRMAKLMLEELERNAALEAELKSRVPLVDKVKLGEWLDDEVGGVQPIQYESYWKSFYTDVLGVMPPATEAAAEASDGKVQP